MRTLRIFLCVPVLALWMTSAAQRQVEDANDDWLFSYKEATAKPVKGIPPQAQVAYDDAGWKSVSVPHTWQTYETTGELHPFIASPHAKDNPYWWNGKGFYRKHFTLRPDNQQWTSNDEFRHQIALRSKKPGSVEDRIDQPNLMVWLYEDHGCDREYRNAPMLHYNPKGWVDSYRVPKYAYYLWQANYAEKPMVFVMPHYWRRQYIGQRRPLVVDSNCEEVELFIGGKSCGVLRPSAENRHSVTFGDIGVRNAPLRVVGRNGGVQVAECVVPMAGPAERLTLRASHTTVDAAPGEVFIVTADIADKAGNHIYGARNTVRWEVEGPATLVGPAEYVSQFGDEAARTGSLYIDMPVSNVVRPTGEPGEIRVRVSADGLASAKTVVRALPRKIKKSITR